MARKSREEIDKNDYDMLIPIDITKFGSEEDPCFGILHDIKAPECMQCGDSEFCSIAKSQQLHKKRLEIETKQRFKDIEEADEELTKKKASIKKAIEKYRERGVKRMKTIIVLSREYKVPKDIVKQLYDQN